MKYLVQLFAAMALVILHCCTVTKAQLVDGLQNKMDLENNFQKNVGPRPKKHLRKYVRISIPPPATLHHTPGKNLELKCEVLGTPAPVAHWLRNGEPIIDYEEDANEIPIQHPSSYARFTSKLVIADFADGDIFTCVAAAGLKEQTASTTVFLEGGKTQNLNNMEKIYSVPTKPVITSFYNELIQEIGTSVILPCRVQSYTQSQVLWEDSEQKPVFGNPRIQVLPSGDLIINALRWADMGDWTCVARNDFGLDKISTFLYPAKRKQQ